MINIHGFRAVRSIAIQMIGWLLVILGIAALVLPGPGLLALFAGLALLATQYRWAERRLKPVKKAALQAAADSIATWPRIAISMVGIATLIAVGIVWGLHPSTPSWWPLSNRWWLPGGWGTGASLIASGILAGATVLYSYRNFREIRHKDPSAVPPSS